MNLINYLKLLRLHQWVKNFFVFTPLIFSGNYSFKNTFYSLISFFLFCLASSVTYIINDILDINEDRRHPIKCKRIIASGKISLKNSLIFAIILLLLTLILSFLHKIISIISVYLILSFLYSVKLKHIVIIDVIVISLGFVLRVIAGALNPPIFLSPWIIAASFLLAMFLALTKRRHELIILGKIAKEHRPVLEHYSLNFIDQTISLVTASVIVVYFIWCLVNPIHVNNILLIISSIFVFYGLFRYLYISYHLNSSISPTEAILKDRAFILNILLWVIYIIIIISLRNKI